MNSYVGQPINRVDGRAKVTGQAKYAAEYNVPNLAYGVVVSSAIAKGRIAQVDTNAALRLEGVLEVFTHSNSPRNLWRDTSYQDENAPPGKPFRPLWDDRILFSGQPVSLVVATSFELARYAASLIRVQYEREPHWTALREHHDAARAPAPRSGVEITPPPRGDAAKAFAKARVQIEAEYVVQAEHHNPMEPFATTVHWEGEDKLTVYDKTQGVQNNQRYVCSVFGLAPENVCILSPFVGGGFGSGLRPQYPLFLAVMAARELKRSVRVVLTRQQMFTLGYRPQTLQRIALGTSASGTLQSLMHTAVAATSRFEDYSEPVVSWSGELYRCKNVAISHKVVPLDLNSPTDMRAPGATWGLFALESAMDELADKLQIDPLDLRLRNYSEKDLASNRKFSSKQLRHCYIQGAQRFGWSNRPAKPRSMRDGDRLVGWGLASGIWFSEQVPASAKAMLTDDGRLTVSSATMDIGTGTYTVMAQIAADALGLPLENVTFQLGDSRLPAAPVEGGSFTAGSVGNAVHAVCEKIRKKVFQLARKMKHSPLAGIPFKQVTFTDGSIRLKDNPGVSLSILDAMRHGKLRKIEAESAITPKEKISRYTLRSHSAIFAEVKVDEDLGTIEVSRLVSAVAAGRILNPKTARSQMIGGIVWGIGTALYEQSEIDHKFGRIMNHNLAEYHVPVNADVNDIEVIFVEEQDSIINPLGVKGLGEIGIVGTAAAIANAIFHATGCRIRELPITLDKLLEKAVAERDRLTPAA